MLFIRRINTAIEELVLDRNGILCDNILQLLPYVYTIMTTMGLAPDPNDEEKGFTDWWEWLIAGFIVVGLIVGGIFIGGTTILGAALLGAGISGGISLGTQAISGELNWGQFALDIGVGAISGALSMTGISTLGSTIVGGTLGGLSSIASDLINGNDINLFNLMVSTTLGAFFGRRSGAGAKNRKEIYKMLSFDDGFNRAMSTVFKVQSRTAAGLYSRAGAAGAARLADRALAKAYMSALDKFVKKIVYKALMYSAINTSLVKFIDFLF